MRKSLTSSRQIALYAATATKTVQAAKANKSLQFRRRLRDFFAPVWGLPLVAVYVPVHDKIRSEGFAVAANISRRSGGAYFCHLTRPPSYSQPSFRNSTLGMYLGNAGKVWWVGIRLANVYCMTQGLLRVQKLLSLTLK